MNIQLINSNTQSNKIIVFFNGWGMDKNAISHLKNDGYDILMINNYTELEPVEYDFSKYKEKYLIAWSMGVWAAAQTTTFIHFDKAIAINGTQDPVDDHEGIPPTIFQGTINNWNERNRDKFNMRILGGKAAYSVFGESLKNRNVTDQKDELIAIQHHIENGYTYLREFDCSIIGDKDAIFAPQNQLKAWKNTENITLDIPHYPFQHFKSWDEIIRINDR